MIRPDYILHALKCGFDGVFIAADGTDCPYLRDCTDRTAKRVDAALKLLEKEGFNPVRLKMAAICSVCVEPFLKHITGFYFTLMKLGPVKNDKGGNTK